MITVLQIGLEIALFFNLEYFDAITLTKKNKYL